VHVTPSACCGSFGARVANAATVRRRELKIIAMRGRLLQKLQEPRREIETGWRRMQAEAKSKLDSSTPKTRRAPGNPTLAVRTYDKRR
jgi:hypothetical protein